MVICKHFICRQLKICLQKSKTKSIRTARFNFVKHFLRLRIVLRRDVVSKPRNARDSLLNIFVHLPRKTTL